jgi:cation diffusion facilitator family transporter
MRGRGLKSKTLLFVEILGDFLSFLAKLIIGILGNSSAMIAEGFRSLTDTTNQFFLLIGIESSKKPPDKEHPFGYGKERFFWAFLSALFIFEVSGGVAIWRGIEKIVNPTPVTNFKISFIVLGISLVLQLFTLWWSSKYYRKAVGEVKSLKEIILKMKYVKDPTAINLWLGDIAAVIGSLLAGSALCLVLITGNPIYDGVASIVIGIILLSLGLFLIQDSKELLIGEAVSPAMYSEIIRIIRSCPEVKEIVRLKTMHLTPNEILINADIDFQENLETAEIERAIDKIENKIKDQIPAATQISIEVESKKIE